MHHVRADGSAVLLLDDDDPVLPLLRERGGELAAMLELTDRAPVDLREPVRALLWITGRIRLPDAEAARRIAVQVADTHPHPDLLRLGHGATLVRLDAGFAVLSDAEGTAALAPIELAAARPDPFCRVRARTGWPTSSGRIRRCSTRSPATCRRRCATGGRPGSDRSAVDRCGLRLRVETAHGDHDVRLAWREQAMTVAELRAQLGLAGRLPVPGARTAQLTGVRPARTRCVTRRSAKNPASGMVPASRMSSASNGFHRPRSASSSVHTM